MIHCKDESEPESLLSVFIIESLSLNFPVASYYAACRQSVTGVTSLGRA
jgi:hypothetical protein